MISICKQRGFTLFELLVAVAMIAVIMSAMSFSINAAVERARIQKATAEVKSITQAILAYENYAEGYELPVHDEPVEANARTLGFLMGLREDSDKGRKVPVLIRAQITTGNALRDPWGTPYQFTIKKGKITSPEMGALSTGFSLPNYHRLSAEERQ